MKFILKFIKGFFGFIATALVHVWCVGAVYFCSFPPSHKDWRLASAVAYLAVVLAAIVFRWRRHPLLSSLIVSAVVIVWFVSIKPDPKAVYPEHLQAPYAEFNGDIVTIHNVRNSEYRTRDDFDVHYETRSYNIKELQTLDVFFNYWGMDAIAHVFVSFGFSDGRYLPVSIEIRPEVGEKYGMIDGFFKQYELLYIWADERDVVRTRTNYRKEDAYLYRIKLSPENIRKLFLSMLTRTNDMHEHSGFYNTLFESCTNTIGDHLKSAGILKVPFWKRRFRSGIVDQRLYHEGLVDTSIPFSELRSRAKINDRAIAADKDPDFSAKIRTHLQAQ